jgi:ribonuclease-3
VLKNIRVIIKIIAHIMETPYNPRNILINESDVNFIFSQYVSDNSLTVNDINIYRRALVHKSYTTRKNDNILSGNIGCPPNCLPLQELNNERFEFLGDAIIKLTVADYIYRRYPQQNEGFLTRLRAGIENGHMLGYLAGKIGLSRWIIISRQIEDSDGRSNYKLLEDAFESFIAATYIDMSGGLALSPIGAGYQKTAAFIVEIIERHINFAKLIADINANITRDKLLKNNIKFHESDSFMENGRRIYIVIAKCGDSILANGRGFSRKEAENNAAINISKMQK